MAEDHSSGSSIPEGDQFSPHYADQMGEDPQQREAVSPVSGVPLRWQGDIILCISMSEACSCHSTDACWWEKTLEEHTYMV